MAANNMVTTPIKSAAPASMGVSPFRLKFLRGMLRIGKILYGRVAVASLSAALRTKLRTSIPSIATTNTINACDSEPMM